MYSHLKLTLSKYSYNPNELNFSRKTNFKIYVGPKKQLLEKDDGYDIKLIDSHKNIEVDATVVPSITSYEDTRDDRHENSIERTIKSAELIIYACPHSGKSTLFNSAKYQLADTDDILLWPAFLPKFRCPILTNVPWVGRVAKCFVLVVPSRETFEDRVRQRLLEPTSEWYDEKLAQWYDELLAARVYADLVIYSDDYLGRIPLVRRLLMED